MDKFGIREVCNCTFKALGGQPSHVVDFVIDTAKMSTLEGATTTVYASGGQGHSRLIAWEGERTLTFTVENALMTMDSFQAMSGAVKASADNKSTFSIYTNKFAGYYRVEAQTLIRDIEGIDHSALIIIPKAKLQTTINIPMGSSGDPSTFTFTFDAFPTSENKLLDLVIDDLPQDNIGELPTTIINVINGNELGEDYTATSIQVTSKSFNPELKFTTITLNDGAKETRLMIKISDENRKEWKEFGNSTWQIPLTTNSRLLCQDGSVVTDTTLVPGGEPLFVIRDI